MEFNMQTLYPTLPSAPSGEADGKAHSYRLQKIGEVQKTLEEERDKRSTLSKKYHSSSKIISVINRVLVLGALGLSGAGIGVLYTIVAIPVAVAMESVAAGFASLSKIGNEVNKKTFNES